MFKEDTILELFVKMGGKVRNVGAISLKKLLSQGREYLINELDNSSFLLEFDDVIDSASYFYLMQDLRKGKKIPVIQLRISTGNEFTSEGLLLVDFDPIEIKETGDFDEDISRYHDALRQSVRTQI